MGRPRAPLLPTETGYALWNLPRLVFTSPHSLVEQLPETFSAFSDGRIAAELVGVVGSLVLICPMAGAAYLTVRLAGRLARGAVRATEGSTRLRAVMGMALPAGVSLLITAWWHRSLFRRCTEQGLHVLGPSGPEPRLPQQPAGGAAGAGHHRAGVGTQHACRCLISRSCPPRGGRDEDIESAISSGKKRADELANEDRTILDREAASAPHGNAVDPLGRLQRTVTVHRHVR
ncbi:hypothetical protein [Streptomyces sp. NPDC059378]|uniref:hypothetical protein n=1 Tax=Streptomyces sp. NPDC059378 TaxID=3346815 RepID=UPI0036B4B028